MIGKTIRIYLSDGNVSGIRHGEIVNWTGQAVACPRLRYSDLKNWPETKKPGVYFLFGPDEQGGGESVYIGEAEVVLDRLKSHINEKDFWNEVILFTNKDDNLTKGHVKYLESRLISLAQKAGRYKVINLNEPQPPSLPRSDRDAMEEFIEFIKVLLGVLGHKVLEPFVESPFQAIEEKESEKNLIIKNQGDKNLRFFLKIAGLKATAFRTDEGLVVLKGSQASKKIKSSFTPGNQNLRAKLENNGILVDSGEMLTFSQDFLFSSPSQAASMVVGYSINGRDFWKTENGETFAIVEQKLALDLLK